METTILSIIKKINKYIISLDERITELEAQTKKQDLLITYIFMQGGYDLDDFKKTLEDNGYK